MATEETLDGGTLTTLEPGELQAKLATTVLIDVRTPQEYALNHVEGALLVPLAELDPKRLPHGGDGVVFMCGSGVRSKKAAARCFAAGARAAAHLGGGFGAWKSAGLPYRGVDPMTGAPKTMG
ncbi:MAG: rhodanese-like domain-containing protein [Myxococcota bacterium]